MINMNTNLNPIIPDIKTPATTQQTNQTSNKGFGKAVNAIKQKLSEVDNLQKQADTSVIDLLTGKNNDITSVVSTVAKADTSFKLLLGVRNKLIEAYKQTMNMNI